MHFLKSETFANVLQVSRYDPKSLSTEKNPFPAKNQALRSYRLCLFAYKVALSALIQIESEIRNRYFQNAGIHENIRTNKIKNYGKAQKIMLKSRK